MRKHEGHPEARRGLSPVRVLLAVAARLAPRRYRDEIRAFGGKLSAHGFADAAVILALVHDAGFTLPAVGSLAIVGLVIAYLDD